jgi:hypothetical protein
MSLPIKNGLRCSFETSPATILPVSWKTKKPRTRDISVRHEPHATIPRVRRRSLVFGDGLSCSATVSRVRRGSPTPPRVRRGSPTPPRVRRGSPTPPKPPTEGLPPAFGDIPACGEGLLRYSRPSVAGRTRSETGRTAVGRLFSASYLMNRTTDRNVHSTQHLKAAMPPLFRGIPKHIFHDLLRDFFLRWTRQTSSDVRE